MISRLIKWVKDKLQEKKKKKEIKKKLEELRKRDSFIYNH